MKGWILSDDGSRIKETEAVRAENKEVKIKMITAIVPDSAGNGVIAGSDGVGMVTEVGDEVTSLKRGDRVLVRPVSACGACAKCRAGKRSECEKGVVYGKTADGTLRDFMIVPASDLILLPSQVDEETAVFTSLVATAIETFGRLNVEKGEHVVILGANAQGLIAAQVAIYYQAIPVLVDYREDLLDLGRKLGIYYTVNAVDADPVKKVFTITCGKMAENLIYNIGSGVALTRAFDYIGARGRTAFVGEQSAKGEYNVNMLDALRKDASVYTVSGGGENIYSAINMLVGKAVDVEPLIEKRVSFEEVGEAAEALRAGETPLEVIMEIR